MNSGGGGGGILHIMLIINRRRNPNPPIFESLLRSAGRQLAPANENRLEVPRDKKKKEKGPNPVGAKF